MEGGRHKDREGESGRVEVERVGEREIGKPCVIPPLLALEATRFCLNDIFEMSEKQRGKKRRCRHLPFFCANARNGSFLCV